LTPLYPGIGSPNFSTYLCAGTFSIPKNYAAAASISCYAAAAPEA